MKAYVIPHHLGACLIKAFGDNLKAEASENGFSYIGSLDLQYKRGSLAAKPIYQVLFRNNAGVRA
jgi:hypothetical protein